MTTPEVYQTLIDKYNLRDWKGFREYKDLRREYKDLRREYEDLRPVHNLDPVHCNVWNVKWTNNGALHPCQKPTEVLERMIKCSSRPGAVVLDCFMGSGSTGVAAVNTGRKFIGIELDEKFFETAKHRIAEALNARMAEEIKEKNKENEAAPEAVF